MTPTAVPHRTSSGGSRIAIDAILISKAPIFLPRYSGVRPIISPAMNTATSANMIIPYRPEPTPPKITSPNWMSHIGIIPASGMNESCIELTEPFDADVVATAHSTEFATPKRVSLPSMLPPMIGGARDLVDAELGEHRVARRLQRVRGGQQRDEHDRHRRQQRPALPGVADHLPERVAKRRGNEQDREQFQEIRQRIRILERMRRVDVEEAAAVGAELLDGDLRRRGPERDRLLGGRRLLGDRVALVVLQRLPVRAVLRVVVGHRLDERDGGVLVERLHDALAHQHQRKDERKRQQDVDRRPHEVEPEIADVVDLLAGEAADQRDQHRHARRGRNEVLDAEPEHLREIAHRAFAAVALPVGIGDEARCRVERRIRADRRHLLRIERQEHLKPLQRVDRQSAEQVEPEHRQRVVDPAHFARRVHARAAIDEALEPAADALRAHRASFVDRGHVARRAASPAAAGRPRNSASCNQPEVFIRRAPA